MIHPILHPKIHSKIYSMIHSNIHSVILSMSNPTAFVGSSVLGVAAGLLLAFPLGYIPDSTLSVLGIKLDIDEVTVAGWILALLWSLFMVIGGLFFEEPREKLQAMQG